MQITIEISDKMMRDIESLNETRNKAIEPLLQQILERGVYQLAYRTQRNKEQYQLLKGYRESLRK